jgi:DNA-binding NarL/FixJ family response regulator
MERLRIAIIEDEPEIRFRFESILREQDWLEVTGVAADAASGRMLIETQPADLYLIDLGLPDGDGLDLIRLAARLQPEADLLVVTVFGDDGHVIASIEAGATGYLLKDTEPEDMLQWIRTIRAGGSPLNPVIARRLLQRFRAGSAGAGAGGFGFGGNGNASRDSVRRDDAGHANVHHDNLHRDDVHRDDVHRDDVHRDDVHRDNLHRDDVHRDDVHRDDVHRDSVRPIGIVGAAAGEPAQPQGMPAIEPNPLSRRETEILSLLAKGLSYAEIGALLSISAHTVTQHIKKIYRKLSVHSRGEAVFEATLMGILPAAGRS